MNRLLFNKLSRKIEDIDAALKVCCLKVRERTYLRQRKEGLVAERQRLLDEDKYGLVL
jgi:hypothetical protein